jgi:hypothetical protein
MMIPILLVFGVFLGICMMLILSESRCDRQSAGSFVDASYWGTYTPGKVPGVRQMMALHKLKPEENDQQFGSITAHPTI